MYLFLQWTEHVKQNASKQEGHGLPGRPIPNLGCSVIDTRKI